MEKLLARTLFTIVALWLYAFSVSAQQLHIDVSNIRNGEGQLQLAVFTTPEAFDNDQPMLVRRYAKTGLVNGMLSVELELSPGHYGIALLDDENSNTKMDYNWIGMPLEGFGFSNYYHTAWSRPGLEDFDFDLTAEGKTVSIKVRYL